MIFPVHSSFAEVPHADGPDIARATGLELIRGSWADGSWTLRRSSTHRGGGEIHAGWVLQGRAIQDVWDPIDDFVCERGVTHEIPEAVQLVNLSWGEIAKCRFEGGQISVNVADQSDLLLSVDSL